MNKDKILNEFEALPKDAQQQVIDFIAFLQTRYKPETSEEGPKKKEITDESFIGIWKNRDDFDDSSAWVRNTRKTEWGNTA
jgi:hypothetical protein